LLEGGACDDERLAAVDRARDDRMHGGKPGRAVAVGQRLASSHPLDVVARLQIVGVHERPSEFCCERPPDRRLASAGGSHHHNHHL
jgi:hypothetical protein